MHVIPTRTVFIGTAPLPDSPPRLLVLAGGLGTRFGGSKQIEALGPDGAWIMDYSIADAVRHGVERVVVVVRREIRAQVEDHLASRLPKHVEFSLVEQDLRTGLPLGVTVPDGRTRPWGTAHAVLAAQAELPGPFVVVNADDVYGDAGMSAALRELVRPGSGWLLVGYRVGDTLSEHGGVSRGLCRVDAQGRLVSIEEAEGLRRGNSGRIEGRVGDAPVSLEPGERVSMNLWGLDPTVFPVLRDAFEAFVRSGPGERAELRLPDVVGIGIESGRATARVLPAGEEWLGVTHAEDRGAAKAALARIGAPDFGD